MTDRELQKLNRRELLELFRAQARSCEAAKKRLEELEQENQTLKESLTRIGKTMKEQREREEAVDAALAEKTAVLAEKDAALQRLERELAEAGSEQADKGRLEEQVNLLFERFRQIKPVLQEKDRQLRASEERIAEQERTIRSLRERLGGRG
jgi:phage-related tail protein